MTDTKKSGFSKGRTSLLQVGDARLELVLNFAEITDGKRVKNQQIFFIDVVDLVPGVARNEQHSSGVNVVHHVLNGDRSAP